MKKALPVSLVLVGVCLGMMIGSACSSGGNDAHAAAGECSQCDCLR